MIVPSTKPYFSKRDIDLIGRKVSAVLKSGRLILGPFAKELEDEFKRYIGTKYAVAVSSCTAALEIVLRFIDVSGSEVIVPTNTFVASANSVLFANGKPVLCDIYAGSLCADIEDIKRRITSRTKAVIIVHVAGLPYQGIEDLKSLCRRKGIYLIEDVAHALGASLNGRKTGSFGLAGCFSFYPTKIITTGTGGMITTDNKQLADFAVSLRHHGVGSGLTDIVNLGNDWVLDEIRSAVGLIQLGSLEEFVRSRNKVAAIYCNGLKNMENLKLFSIPKNTRHAYYKFPVILKTRAMREKLRISLAKRHNISTGSIYYPPCHLQPLYKRSFGYGYGDFPVAEDILNRVLCLPIFSHMGIREAKYVIDCLKKELKKIEK